MSPDRDKLYAVRDALKIDDESKYISNFEAIERFGTKTRYKYYS